MISQAGPGKMRLDTYQTEAFYDEMFEADGQPRPRSTLLAQRLESLSEGSSSAVKRRPIWPC